MHKDCLLLFFDRDGTLIQYVPYLSSPEQVELMPGVQDGLRRLKAWGHKLFLHTNQSGVSRGYFSLEDAVACNERMLELLEFDTSPFEEICIAPGISGLQAERRKPAPLFAREMLEKHGCHPGHVIYIGDAVSDLLCARHVGGHGIGVDTGVGELREKLAQIGLLKEFQVVDTFAEAVELIRGGQYRAL